MYYWQAQLGWKESSHQVSFESLLQNKPDCNNVDLADTQTGTMKIWQLEMFLSSLLWIEHAMPVCVFQTWIQMKISLYFFSFINLKFPM